MDEDVKDLEIEELNKQINQENRLMIRHESIEKLPDANVRLNGLINETHSEGDATMKLNTEHLTTNRSESSGFRDGPQLRSSRNTMVEKRLI